MTQTELKAWGKQRIADAPKIAKAYERQGLAVEKLIGDRGCDCDPSYVIPITKDGTFELNRVEIVHSLICTTN